MEQVLIWLSSLEPQLRQQDFNTIRLPGSGAWFLGTAEYRSWEEGDNNGPILLCIGAPGTGKTMLW